MTKPTPPPGEQHPPRVIRNEHPLSIGGYICHVFREQDWHKGVDKFVYISKPETDELIKAAREAGRAEALEEAWIVYNHDKERVGVWLYRMAILESPKAARGDG